MAVGLPQVTVANPEDTHFGSSNRPARLPRGGDYWLLQRAVDPPHDHFFRPYVLFISVGEGARTNDGSSMAGAASFTIYTRTKEFFRDHHLIDHSKLLGCSVVGGIGGAMAGSIISFGSARECPCNPAVPFSHHGMPVSFRACQGAQAFMRPHLYQLLTNVFRFGGSWNTR